MEWLNTTWGNNLFMAGIGFMLGGVLTSMWLEHEIRTMCKRCNRYCRLEREGK